MPLNIEEITRKNALVLLTSALKDKNKEDIEEILSKLIPLCVKMDQQHIDMAIELGDKTLLNSMLKVALLQEETESVYKLIQCNLDVDIIAQYECETATLLKFAIDQNDEKLAESILKKDQKLLSKYREVDFYPVSYAIGDRDSEHIAISLSMIKLLLEYGGSPNEWSFPFGSEYAASPIETAVIHNRKDILELLIQYGGEHDSDDVSDCSPLSTVVSSGDIDMVDYLLKTLPGIATDCRQAVIEVWETPSVIALAGGHWEIAKKLVQFELDRGSQILANDEELSHFLDNPDAFRFIVEHFALMDGTLERFIAELLKCSSIEEHKEKIKILSDKYHDFMSKLFTAAVIDGNVQFVKSILDHCSDDELCIYHNIRFSDPDKEGPDSNELGSALDYAVQKDLSNEMIDLLYANKVPCISLMTGLKHLIETNSPFFQQLIHLEPRGGEQVNYDKLLNYAFLYDREEMSKTLMQKVPDNHLGLYHTEYKRHQLLEFLEQHSSMIIDKAKSVTVSVRDKLDEIFSDCVRDFLTLMPIVNLVCLKEPNSAHIDCFEHRSIFKHLIVNQFTIPKHPLRQAEIASGSILTLELAAGKNLKINELDGHCAFSAQEDHPDLWARRNQMVMDLKGKWAKATKLAEDIKEKLNEHESDGSSTKKRRLV